MKRSRRVLNTGTSAPWSWVCPLPDVLTTHLLGGFVEGLLRGPAMGDQLASSLSPSRGWWGWKSQIASGVAPPAPSPALQLSRCPSPLQHNLRSSICARNQNRTKHVSLSHANPHRAPTSGPHPAPGPCWGSGSTQPLPDPGTGFLRPC